RSGSRLGGHQDAHGLPGGARAPARGGHGPTPLRPPRGGPGRHPRGLRPAAARGRPVDGGAPARHIPRKARGWGGMLAETEAYRLFLALCIRAARDDRAGVEALVASVGDHWDWDTYLALLNAAMSVTVAAHELIAELGVALGSDVKTGLELLESAALDAA